MMSREPTLKTRQETLLFIKKIEEKKKILAEAEADYNNLCTKVDKTNLELNGLKMERFKVEGLVQELDIRVKVYDMREKELKEQDERAKRSIKEAKNRLAQELEVRDSFDRKFSRKVIEMASEFCQFKDSCLKTKVVANLQDLKTLDGTFTSEIESKMQNLGLSPADSQENKREDEICEYLLQQVYQPKENLGNEMQDICELQNQIQAELDLVEAKNTEVSAHVDRLLNRKSSLLKVMDSLKTTWNK